MHNPNEGENSFKPKLIAVPPNHSRRMSVRSRPYAASRTQHRQRGDMHLFLLTSTTSSYVPSFAATTNQSKVAAIANTPTPPIGKTSRRNREARKTEKAEGGKEQWQGRGGESFGLKRERKKTDDDGGVFKENGRRWLR